MVEIKQSETFSQWVGNLRDVRLQTLILGRVDRLRRGLAGDVKPIGAGLNELRIHYGAGYRIYFQQRGQVLFLILCGGDKSTQRRDIEKAKQLARDWEI